MNKTSLKQRKVLQGKNTTFHLYIQKERRRERGQLLPNHIATLRTYYLQRDSCEPNATLGCPGDAVTWRADHDREGDLTLAGVGAGRERG